MQKACGTRQRSKRFLKANGAPGAARLKESWRTPRFTRCHGAFRWKIYMFRCGFGMERKTGPSLFALHKKSRSDCQTAKHVSLMRQATIRCQSVTCGRV